MLKNKTFNTGLAIVFSFMVSSCATQQGGKPSESSKGLGFVAAPPPAVEAVDDQEALVLSQEATKEPEYFVKKGSGVFLNQKAQAKLGTQQPARGDITLNFEGVDLREVVKVVFEEILRENYVIDDKVQGVVTIHTTYPVASEAVLPILETILQMNGAALVRNGSLYKILPAADLKDISLSPSVGTSTGKLKAGQGVQIVPLKYISAKEMKKILESFSTANEQIRVDNGRNLLILSGSYQKIRNLLQTVEMFDVDWLSGMSFGLMPLKFTDAKTLTDELNNILGDETSPLAGLVRLIPVQRLNAVMVISQQPKYINEARKLITQFDQGSDKSPDRRLYVYHLKNGKAENIATILQNIFGNQVSTSTSSGNAGGSDPLSRSNVRSPTSSGISLASSNADSESSLAKDQPAAASASPYDSSAEPDQGAQDIPATIIADPDNNAILVMASPMDYNKIKSTIARLDISPKQVLIEATIAEVVLNDNLSYGVRWFFEGTTGGGRPYQGALGDPLGSPDQIGGSGFSLGIFNNTADLKAFFNVLEDESAVKFLSAPQIMVIDNQTATFRVGDQIPIITRSSQSTTDSDAPIVSELQYRDTGTLLQVTPRINEGGMVTLEISQEVSSPGAVSPDSGGNPPISQRTIESTVVVHDGQSIVLGGLIRETETDSKSGIPGLMHIPVVGNLFSSTGKGISRTELIVTLTPKVVRNPQEAYEISQELREKIKEATLYQEEFNLRGSARQ
ncbi:MAG: type II secretion system secretin GspD [Candidatus Thiodiazotropha sp. (ex Monitilora ramsayi)]|nr:type II secretion system secretin GspD [Candidatus Thiodiazotropha sp. (ex Monitilora ramsayi)]